MKHLQKFPTTPGDSITLGTIVAIGVKPDSGQFFVTFDSYGELRTYLIIDPDIAYSLISIFKKQTLNSSEPPPRFKELNARNDIKLDVIKEYPEREAEYRLYKKSDPNDFDSFEIKNSMHL